MGCADKDCSLTWAGGVRGIESGSYLLHGRLQLIAHSAFTRSNLNQERGTRIKHWALEGYRRIRSVGERRRVAVHEHLQTGQGHKHWNVLRDLGILRGQIDARKCGE